MFSSFPSSRPYPSVPAALLAAAACAMLAACASSGSSGAGRRAQPPTSDQAYSGPAVAIDSTTGPNHLIVLSAPTPGWSFTFDQVGSSGQDAFVTITRPDPGLLYPAMIVEQKMDSTVPSGKPLRVFVRIVDFGGKAGSQPYRLAKVAGK